MKFIIGIFKFFFNSIFRFFRMLTIGIGSALFITYILNGILKPSNGVSNINIAFFLYSFVPLFLVLFTEFFFYFLRRARKKNKLNKDVGKYKLS